MTWRFVAMVVAVIGFAGTANAEPTHDDIVEGLTNAGVLVDSPAAYDFEGCERNASQPGYLCTFSFNECARPDGSIEQYCDNPGVSEHAIFIGGDNGWLALDVQLADGTATPRLPLDPSARAMTEVTPQWLEGSWNPEGNCENDATFFLYRGGAFAAIAESGRWALEGSELVVTLTASADDEGSDILPLAEPRITRWRIHWLGLNVGGVTTPDGANVSMVRCS